MPTPRSPHARDPAELAAALGTSLARGLDSSEAHARLAHDGPNALPEPRSRSTLALVAAQLASPLVGLLGVAAAVAWGIGERHDALVIVGVVVLNAALGALQEGRAEAALASLRRREVGRVRVVRDGREGFAPVPSLVVGDVVVLEAGDAVPADVRIVEAARARAAEAALTGESVPVDKGVEAVRADAALAERGSMLFAATHLVAGRARGLVVATGPFTEVGLVARLAEGAREPPSPLVVRIRGLGRAALVAAAVSFVGIGAIGILRGIPIATIAMVAISQVVGLVPEGLPIAVTVALAAGVRRMARRGAIVRRLGAVEALGAVTVVATDKTGTLTKNELTVQAIALPSGRRLRVEGVGYSARGGVFGEDGRAVDTGDAEVVALARACVLCNDARTGSGDVGGVLGDPTEVALLVVARKLGVDLDAVRAAWPRTGEIPFDPSARFMATEHADPAGPVVFLKGAPEAIVATAKGGDGAAGRMAEAAHAFAQDALRGLAVARVRGALAPVESGLEAYRGRAELLGVVGALDPPREQAPRTVAALQAAGVRLVVVTGDHRDTACAIARSVGLGAAPGEVVEGSDVARLAGGALDRLARDVTVVARAEPAHKLRLVEALQRAGEVVVVTGDGVNDAPALRRADVGVAMGRSGTEVAKDASKVVITDDDLATIVSAIEEGRVVHRNVRKTLVLLLGTSIAELVVLTVTLATGHSPPFSPAQILWNNLVTEGVITVNLALDPPEGDELAAAPIGRHEPLVTGAMLVQIGALAGTIGALTLGWIAWRTSHGLAPGAIRTEAFTLLAVCEWYGVLVCRAGSRPALDRRILSNLWLVGGLVAANLLQLAAVYVPVMNRALGTEPLPARVALALGCVGAVVLVVGEFVRRALAWRRAARAKPSA